jgi:hypothetical protein
MTLRTLVSGGITIWLMHKDTSFFFQVGFKLDFLHSRGEDIIFLVLINVSLWGWGGGGDPPTTQEAVALLSRSKSRMLEFLAKREKRPWKQGAQLCTQRLSQDLMSAITGHKVLTPSLSLDTILSQNNPWRVSSSGIWRRVVHCVATDVSEEHSASIFRIEEKSRKPTSKQVADDTLYNHCCENLKSYRIIQFTFS